MTKSKREDSGILHEKLDIMENEEKCKTYYWEQSGLHPLHLLLRRLDKNTALVLNTYQEMAS